MNNKVLIKLIIPEMDFDFDLFIPINEQIWKIKKLIIKSISDMSSINISQKYGDIILINKSTGELYKNSDIVVNTNIRNSTELVAISSRGKRD